MVQPLSDVTVVRPWHWGIAMVVDPECEAPDVRPEQVVTVDESGLVVLVRHAQDLEADALGGRLEVGYRDDPREGTGQRGADAPAGPV